jgi:subtilisin family serine protease
VKEATEAGVSYFSSAGNNNLKNGNRNIASWEAPEYRDASSCPAAIAAFSQSLEAEGEAGLNPAHCMDFDPGAGVDEAFRITVSKGATLIADLQWAEPWEGVKTNLDAFLLGPEGAVVSASIADNVHGSKRPFELVSWENETSAAANVQLVINRFEGAGNPRLKFALLQNGDGVTSTNYETSTGEDVVGPTIFGHNGSEDAISVGAVPYDSEEAPERYSSRGPVTHYFGPVTGAGPAASLGSPQLLEKPDLVATDGGADTFFGECQDAWRFFGTSASAPHAAAVAALEREADPSASAEKVEEAMKGSARPVGFFPPTAVGAGLIDAVGAIESLGVAASDPGAEVAEPPPPGPCLPPREPGGIQPHAVEPQSPPTPPVALPVHRSRPRTFFLQRPSKVIRTRHQQAKAVFRFGSDESEASFVCRVDGSFFRSCPARLARQFTLGWHVIKVAALDTAGNGDKTPASYSFKVKRVR